MSSEKAPNVSKWASTNIYTIRNSLWWKYLFCLSDKLCQKVGSKNAKSEKKNTFSFSNIGEFLRNKQDVGLHELSHYGIKKHNLLWALNAKLLKGKKKDFSFFPISVHVFLSTIFCCIENILNILNDLVHGRIFKKNDFSLHYCLMQVIPSSTVKLCDPNPARSQAMPAWVSKPWEPWVTPAGGQIKVFIQVVCSGEKWGTGKVKISEKVKKATKRLFLDWFGSQQGFSPARAFWDDYWTMA